MGEVEKDVVEIIKTALASRDHHSFAEVAHTVISALDAAGFQVQKKPEIDSWHGWAHDDPRISAAQMTDGTLVLWLIAESRPIKIEELRAMLAASSNGRNG